MSEVTLTICDGDRAIHGRVHGSDAERAIAALAAEPETIEELEVAMRRFADGDDPSRIAPSCIAHFRPDDADEPWDAGVVIIDLAARLIAGQSTYAAISNSGSVQVPSSRHAIRYHLSDDWQIEPGSECWRSTAEFRRRERARQPQVDAREVLYGQPMLDYVAKHIAKHRSLESSEAVKKVHADWLMTVRDDLGSKSPREVLLARQDFIDLDLQYRTLQWSRNGHCPPGLKRDTAAYRYAGFGTHEIVTYYELLRHLLWECRERLEQECELNRKDEVRRLEKLRDDWLECPDPEFHGRTPASIIDNERRRIPEGVSGAEAVVDPDCPCCQMMAQDLGPCFWHLDGCNTDDEFAFSFYRTRQEWEEEQRHWEDFDRPRTQRESGQQPDRDARENVWARCYTNEEFHKDLPVSQLVPIAVFGFAAMVGELNQDLNELSGGQEKAQQETLNRLLGNVRNALSNSAELIDPTLDRLVQELTDVAERYPNIGKKCADLSRRLTEFPAKMVASYEREKRPF